MIRKGHSLSGLFAGARNVWEGCQARAPIVDWPRGNQWKPWFEGESRATVSAGPTHNQHTAVSRRELVLVCLFVC